MKRSLIINVITWFFVVLFVYTGIEKLIDYKLFTEELSLSPIAILLPFKLAWLIPLVELLIPVLLIRPVWRIKGLYASLILMAVFTAYLMIPNKSDALPSCGCGGIIENLSLKQHLVFNTTCVVLSLFGIMEASLTESPTWLRSVTVINVTLAFSTIIVVLLLSMRTTASNLTGLEGKPIPQLDLLLADSTTRINLKDIHTEKSFIVIEMSPYCPHCRAEISDIINHMEYFKDNQIFLITAFPYKDLKYLNERFELNKYSNIKTGIDSGAAFMSYYKASVVPYTAIFDNKKQLIRTMTGRADIISMIRTTRS